MRSAILATCYLDWSSQRLLLEAAVLFLAHMRSGKRPLLVQLYPEAWIPGNSRWGGLSPPLNNENSKFFHTGKQAMTDTGHQGVNLGTNYQSVSKK